MEITAKMVQELREKTGVGMMDCKKALGETQGDFEKAIDLLRKKGMATAAKRADKETHEGVIASYIHSNHKLGVMVEINCETDFVAKTDAFVAFAHDMCMQIAAANPIAVSREEIPADVVEKEKEIYRAQLINEGKPEKMIDKIMEGKLNKFYADAVLTEQKYIKKDDITVQDYLNEMVAKTGERIQIKRFVRFQLGQN
ncbi:MAG: translation elongation factor Ts [Candidatus Delongbacteria bacterium]|nr:translation elongation factor Ts [Candidatus Delongbacteria bacterium]